MGQTLQDTKIEAVDWKHCCCFMEFAIPGRMVIVEHYGREGLKRYYRWPRKRRHPGVRLRNFSKNQTTLQPKPLFARARGNYNCPPTSKQQKLVANNCLKRKPFF